MKQFLCLWACLLSYATYAQINFEKGFYIDKDGERTEVLIKNVDGRSTPAQFEYKKSENSEIKVLEPIDVTEIGIYNYSTYRAAQVEIDRSSNNLNNLSSNSAPFMQQEELFLKLLIDGKASLFQYKEGTSEKFFYSLDTGKIEQLVQKQYLNIKNKIAQNNHYKQQLWNNLKCDPISSGKLEKLDYRETDLIQFFKNYNECQNSEFKSYERESRGVNFNLSIRPRYNNSSLNISNSGASFDNAKLDSKSGFGLGLEAELILPFNRNKWSLFLEPTYQSYKSDISNEVDNISGGDLNVKADYSSIEMNTGLRHYFFLNQNSKIFVNAAYVFDFAFESEVVIKRSFNNSLVNRLNVKTESNFAIGAGYKFKDRYSAEIRMQTDRQILGDYVLWNGDYRTISVIIGYSLF